VEKAARALTLISVLAAACALLALIVPDIYPFYAAAPDASSAARMLAGSLIHPVVLLALAGAGACELASRRRPVTVPVEVDEFLPALPPGTIRARKAALAIEALKLRMHKLDASALVALTVQAAIRSEASDIHLHPRHGGMQLSLRVDGDMIDVGLLPPELQGPITNRLKVLTRLVLYITDRPQDGHFPIATPDGSAEIRASFLPTEHGEKIVLRVGRTGMQLPSIEQVGLTPALLERVKAMLDKPQGLIFFTGPIGSGKTTSIYAALGHIRATRRGGAQIATIEDPIELVVPAFAQTKVNRQAGLDFAQGFRALLRQDPNVIAVGEIRDSETANIAMQSGLTGHLILTTVHADSAAGVFNRLLEMGIEPFVLASVSLACVSQRLVKQLCAHCRVPAKPTPEQAARLAAAKLTGSSFFAPRGCPRCDSTGWNGRTAVYEILEISPAVREALQKNLDTSQLMKLAIAEGTVPLFEAAVEHARLGRTTLAEAMRVAG
jgi:general secretion pathway protein E